MIDQALAWVDRRFAVFPLKPRDKIPLGALVPHGAKDASRDLAVIRDWWRREPQANIGIATGGGHFVVDLDGAEAKGAWINMCGRHGAPERTLTVKTARGFHLFFSSRLEIPNSASRLAPHVDVRGDGGYVVAAPSIHPSGAVYTIARDLSIAPAPRWLVDLAMPDERPEQLPEPMSARRMSLMGRGRALEGVIGVVASAPRGKRNDLLFWVPSKLRPWPLKAGWPSPKGKRALSRRPHKPASQCLKSKGRSQAPSKGESAAMDDTTPPPDSIVDFVSRAKKKRQNRPQPPNGPIARFDPAAPHETATEAERAIIAPKAKVFHRGGELVEPIIEHVPTYGGGKTQIITLRAVEKARLLDLMSEAARWEKYSLRENDFVATSPPALAADILLARAGHWSFHRISGVITTPTLRPDGSILSEPGFDPATQLFHAMNHDLRLPPISEKPTKKEALAALALLESLLAEFPFADQKIDEAVALSALITPVIQAAIDVAPMHAVKAPEYGSGKSYLVNLVSAIATGAPCPVTTAARDEAETDKRLDAALLKCQPIISLDNVNDVLCSDRLAVAVEQAMITVRILGLSKTVDIENKACIFSTGCNMAVRGDMVRRTILCSIDPNEEAPEKRTFKRNPYQEILADRGKFIAAILTVVRAYLAGGDPNVDFVKLASFDAWSRFVQRPLIRLGRGDPAQSVAISEEADPDRGGVAEVLAAWHNAIADEPVTLKSLAAKA
jgi:putative DNA primase/helicase